MATVLFDFDSTLIQIESLEKIVERHLDADPIVRDRYAEITNQGMSGGWTFTESLSTRLDLVPLMREDAVAFGRRAPEYWTEGLPELIETLHQADHEVWLISGAMVEALREAATHLAIPPTRVLGVQLDWSGPEGRGAVDLGDPFSESKVAGVHALRPEWPRPAVMVGDGFTDRALFDAGLVEYFVPFTANVRRPSAIPEGVPEASSAMELSRLLDQYLGSP